LQARDVPPAEAAALRAELLFLSPGLPRTKAHLAESRCALAEALRLDSSHPLALAVEMALPENAEAAAPLERIRAAAARRPSDYRAQMLLAFAVGAQRPDERRAALVRAAELAPENAAVLNALAWHDLTHGRASQAVPVAQKAAELAPARAAVLDTYATALAKASRCEEAVRVEERAVELTAEHASGELRKRLLARLDAMRAGCGNLPSDDE
jgi:Flp pilus assembly protein TadD